MSELVGLNISSVDFNESFIKVYGKGKRERIIPFGKKAKDTLQIYLKNRELAYVFNKEIPLFTSNRGNRISVRTVQDRLNKYLKSIIGGLSDHEELMEESSVLLNPI